MLHACKILYLTAVAASRITEGHDRPDLAMPGVQTQLLKQLYAVNKKIVLLVLTGGPISMTWEAANLPAIMVSHHGTQS